MKSLLKSPSAQKLSIVRIKHYDAPNCDSFKSKFKEQAQESCQTYLTERQSYFRNLISSYSMQPKKLWSVLDSLLCRKSASCRPAYDSPSLLAFSFLNYFGDKIAKLSSSLTSSAFSSSPHVLPESSPPSLSSFTPATFDEVCNAISLCFQCHLFLRLHSYLSSQILSQCFASTYLHASQPIIVRRLAF